MPGTVMSFQVFVISSVLLYSYFLPSATSFRAFILCVVHAIPLIRETLSLLATRWLSASKGVIENASWLHVY